jgi:hypothetical protein
VRHFAKASCVGSTTGTGKSRGPIRSAFATRGESSEGKGSCAASRRRPFVSLLATLAVALTASLVLSAAVALADTAPAVTIAAPTAVSFTSAHVSGTVDPEGGPSTTFWHFEFSTEPSDPGSWRFAFAAEGALSGAEAEGTAPVAVAGNLEGLQPGTEYSVRLVAENGEGFNRSETGAPYPAFTTDPVAVPTVAINPITVFTGTSAHLSGTINPNGSASAFNTSWDFECVPQCPGLNGGTVTADGASHVISEEAGGLEPNTAYEVRLIAFNAGGQAEAGPQVFETDRVAPSAQTLSAGAVGTASATLAGEVNPKNSIVTYQFEWGAGDAFDKVVPAAPTVLGASDDTLHSVTAPITGLTQGTEYRFRIVATNTETSQTSVGVEHSFMALEPVGPPTPCANAEIRSQQSAARLPECRAYEQVTPVDKNGGNLTYGLAISGDGSRIGSNGSASFGDARSNGLGAPYISERRAAGWVTANLSPPAGVGLALDGGALNSGNFMGDLSTSVSVTRSYAGQPQIVNIFATTPDGTTTWVTKPTQPTSTPANNDLAAIPADTHQIIFESRESYSTRDTFGVKQIWEWDQGEVRLVSILPDGSVPSVGEGAAVGNGFNGILNDGTGTVSTFPERTSVSSDGSRIFFTASGTNDFQQLYVREDGTRTVEVSLSQKPGSVGQESSRAVTFNGASTDGSRVVFASPDQLTADATPGGGYYEYEVEGDHLRFLTPGSTTASGAGVEGVANITPDGSKIFFVASAQLVAGQGQPGGHNLYVSEGGEVRYIATLNDLDVQDWTMEFGNAFGRLRTAKSTPDGEHLVFQSVNRLTGDDSAGHVEIYEWSARTGALTCVSCGAPGHHANGDASLLPNVIDPLTGSSATGQNQLGTERGLTDDGSKVFFQTTDSLDPKDINGKFDVYEYAEGHTYLLSSGTGSRDSQIMNNTADGSDVFFSSYDSLAPQDTDKGGGDIYDARVGGGFEVEGASGACQGGDCQAGSAGSPAFRSPASASLAVKGNSTPSAGRQRKLRKALNACRKKPIKARKRCETHAKRRYGAHRTSSKSKGGK